MLALMRDPQVPLEDRIGMAAAAAPFVHIRPDPVRKEAPDPLDPHNQFGEPAETEDLKFASLAAKPNGHEGGGVSPLDFLLSTMVDPAASPRQRLRAAKIAARYTHAYGERAEAASMVVAEDKFGFKVDAELARAERADRLRESRLKPFRPRTAEGIAAAPELERIAKRREERVAGVKFPDGYTYDDRQKDEKRLGQLHGKRLSRKKLTPEEEAEEVHLAVRILNPKTIYPKTEIPVAAPFPGLGKYKMEWPMTRMVELEERVLAGDTTAAEEEELKDLRSHHPQIAVDVDRLDHQYNYCVRRETEKAFKAGLSVCDAIQAERDACGPLRDPRKMRDLEELREGPVGRIHELETLRFDNVLTPEEADELEELHRRYPERAEKTRKMVDRRLSDEQMNRKLPGYNPGPIEEDGWPRMRKGPPRLSQG
jgi:hypothetical protein